jgi:hypothetical protein
MKHLILVCLVLVSCKNNSSNKEGNSVKKAKSNKVETNLMVWKDKLNGKEYPLPDSICGKSAEFYLNNPKIAEITKAFYKGQFRPKDNDSTTLLLSYVTTPDSILRPFYRWCLDFTINISDGALSEYPGAPALTYAINYPKEFFEFIDEDPSEERYKKWISKVAYGGIKYSEKKGTEIESEIIKPMKKNCKFCSENLSKRIISFAKEISKEIKLQD